MSGQKPRRGRDGASSRRPAGRAADDQSFASDSMKHWERFIAAVRSRGVPEGHVLNRPGVAVRSPMDELETGDE